MHTTLGSKQNFLGLEKEYSTFERSKAVVLPVPYQRVAGSGARSAPASILAASRGLSRFDEEITADLASRYGIATLAAFPSSPLKEPAFLTKLSDLVSDLLSHEKFVLTLGGDRLLTSACAAAAAKRYASLSILHFDAHADLSPGSITARMCEFIDPKRIVQAGIRSTSADEVTFAQENGLHVYYAHLIRSGGYTRLLKYWDDALIDDLTDEVYVTIDVDVLEPSEMPSTMSPQPGGLAWGDVIGCLRKVGLKRRIVAADITGLLPSKSARFADVTAAKLAAKVLAHSLG
jgi:agmatinase